jgi:hypothetical protein
LALQVLIDPGQPPTANRQPAFGVYVGDSHTTLLHATGLLALTLAGRIHAMTLSCIRVLALGTPANLPN